MKRIIDFSFSFFGIVILSPIFLITILLIFLNDFNNPFYTPLRMGRHMKPFKMIKFRSMIVDSDKNGINSTSLNDRRITSIGKIIRTYKIDELSQLFNVFIGNMSLVGPRPQIVDHVLNEYSNEEKKLLNIAPGITDFSSIVFSDEGNILKDSLDPNRDYNLLIKPWKSRLGLLYINNQSLLLDLQLILLTILAIFNKSLSLKFINKLLIKFNACSDLIEISKRDKKIIPVK